MLSENGDEHSRGDDGHNSGAGDRGARTPPTIEHRSVRCGADAVAGAGDNDTQQALPSGGGARPHNQASSEASKSRHQDTRIIEQALPSGGGAQTEQRALPPGGGAPTKLKKQVPTQQQALPSGSGAPIKQ